ncbi:hypothetical protein Y032_0078g1153 [Ancylostoma ceylanicum]|uniref:Sulfhydryl oxidase n=1 Tax=Ancylostoma ceylanicum TaxID=53326 RepID=A0A016TTG2_9BILA|nr:hypothetical protein Y032_0078g1153 [Ancylostoma ceylanicum]
MTSQIPVVGFMNVPMKIISYPIIQIGRVCRAEIDETCFLNHNLSWLSDTAYSLFPGKLVRSRIAARGYTCGLWTTFHALTVHTYIDTIKNTNVNPLKPLKSIQGWVKGFFGCQHCKRHFMNMTTNIFPMTERRIRHPHDMMTYLWRAHNIVNNRLHGDPTEDPQFIKMQFPPPFLCPTCHSGGQFSRRQVMHLTMITGCVSS